MKTIDVDEELYSYIASHTQHIGESASEILRRMLNLGPQARVPPAHLLQLTARITKLRRLPRVR